MTNTTIPTPRRDMSAYLEIKVIPLRHLADSQAPRHEPPAGIAALQAPQEAGRPDRAG